MADRPHPTSIAGGPYDGTTFPYIPGSTLSIDPSLTLDREWTDKIDAITYETCTWRTSHRAPPARFSSWR